MKASAVRRTPWPVFLIVAAVGLCFWRVVGGGFLDWDDTTMVVNDPLLAPGHFADVAGAWTHGVNGLYAPLTYTVYAGLAALSRVTADDLTPVVFHLANLVLHTISGVLVWLLLERLTRDRLASAAGALVWAVHPMQVEPVAWIASLNTDLCTTLAVAALLVQTTAVQGEWKRPWTGWAAAGVLFALSMCAKPASVGLPLAALGLNRFLLNQSWRCSLTVTAVAAAIAAPFVVVGHSVQTGLSGFDPALLPRIAVVGHTTAFYLLKFAWPYPVSADYGYDPTTVWNTSAKWAGLALLPIAAVVVWQWKKRPWLAGAFCVYLAGMAPVSGVRDFDFQTYSTVTDRYANFAMLGFSLAVAFAVCRASARRAATVLVAIFVLVCGVLTFDYTAAWHDTRTLHDAMLATNPQSQLALVLEGGFAQRAHDVAAQEAIARRFLERHPAEFRMNKTMAYILLLTNRPGEAVPYFQNAIRAVPDPSLYSDMGLALVNSGRPREALSAIQQAIRLDPNAPAQYVNEAEVYRRLGDDRLAADAYQHALVLSPYDPGALQGMRQLQAAGRGGH